MPIRAMDLFEAFRQNKLPKDQAYIVSSFVNVNTGYTIYEVICYANVKAIYREGNGITFQSSGKKLFILIEPSSYPYKAIEPYLRMKGDQIPFRFRELNMHTAKNQTKIYIAKKPTESMSSFTVTQPIGFNVSFIFYYMDDLYESLNKFFELSFNQDAGVPQTDVKNPAKEAVNVLEKLMNFKSEFTD